MFKYETGLQSTYSVKAQHFQLLQANYAILPIYTFNYFALFVKIEADWPNASVSQYKQGRIDRTVMRELYFVYAAVVVICARMYLMLFIYRYHS